MLILALHISQKGIRKKIRLNGEFSKETYFKEINKHFHKNIVEIVERR